MVVRIFLSCLVLLGINSIAFAEELSPEGKEAIGGAIRSAQEEASELSQGTYRDEGFGADLNKEDAVQVDKRNQGKIGVQFLGQVGYIIPSIDELRSFEVASLDEGTLVYLEGYKDLYDGAQGVFWLDKSNPDLESDGGVIIETPQEGVFWRRVYAGTGVNVRWFGATGAGYPTDDYPAILQAVSRYDYVLFPEGEYYVSSPIPFSSAQRFEGVGNMSSPEERGVLIVGETDCFDAQQLGSNRDVSWLNFALNSRSPEGVGIRFDEVNTAGWSGNPIIQNCIFYANLKYGIVGTIQGGTILNSGFGTKGVPGTAIAMEAGIYLDSITPNSSLRILSCRFHYAQTGILLENSNGVKITGCEFEMLRGVAVWLKGVASATISDSYFERCQTQPDGHDGFIRLDSTDDGVLGCRGTFILGNYFLNGEPKNVDTFIDGQWVTGMTAVANYYAPMREGVTIYNKGARRPMFAVGNILISNVFMPGDEINTFNLQ